MKHELFGGLKSLHSNKRGHVPHPPIPWALGLWHFFDLKQKKNSVVGKAIFQRLTIFSKRLLSA